MIVFFLDGIAPAEHSFVRYALFEVAVRIGLPFRIVERQGEIADSPHVLRYGPKVAEDSDYLELPFARGACEEKEVGGLRLWGSTEKFGFDCLWGAAQLLSFRHELSASKDDIDSLGRIGPEFRNRLGQPNPLVSYVDNTAEFLGREMRANWNLAGTPPYQSSSSAVLTHDCDGPELFSWFELARALCLILAGRGRRESEALWYGLKCLLKGESDPYWNFGGWGSLSEGLGGHSTFLMFPGRQNLCRPHFNDPRYDPSCRKFTTVLRGLVEDGHEIGVHTGIDSYDLDSLRLQKQALEALTGGPIRSSRAHYWSNDWARPFQFWRDLEAIGIRNDGTLSPLRLGLRNGTHQPLMPTTFLGERKSDRLVVLPTPIMDAYLGQASIEAEEVSSFLERLFGVDRICVMDWHVRTLKGVGRWKDFDRWFEVVREKMLTASSRLLTMEEAGQAWRDRVKALDHTL